MRRAEPRVTYTEDRPRAITTVVAAFIADPVVRWVYPDSLQYLTDFPRFVHAFGGRAFETGSAHSLSDHAGVALWLSPGVKPDGDAMGEIMEETVRSDRLDDLLGFAEKQSSLKPQEPHWYLPLMGVDPAYQRLGLGSVLLTHATSQFDEDGLPAYLEATSHENRRLYERHGFIVTGEIQAGSSPTMYAMRRDPH